MFYYVYVLQGVDFRENPKRYVGYCKNLRDRIRRHEKREVESTKSFKSLKLVYYGAGLNKSDAIIREKQLKTGFGRGYLNKRLKNYFKSEVS